jgi:hypothetical protein
MSTALPPFPSCPPCQTIIQLQFVICDDTPFSDFLKVRSIRTLRDKNMHRPIHKEISEKARKSNLCNHYLESP